MTGIIRWEDKTDVSWEIKNTLFFFQLDLRGKHPMPYIIFYDIFVIIDSKWFDLI